MRSHFVPITVVANSGGNGDEVSEMTFSRRPSTDSIDTHSLSCVSARNRALCHPLQDCENESEATSESSSSNSGYSRETERPRNEAPPISRPHDAAQSKPSLSHQAFKVHARRSQSMDMSSASQEQISSNLMREVAELKVALAEAQTEAESHRNLAKKLLNENVKLKERLNSSNGGGEDDDSSVATSIVGIRRRGSSASKARDRTLTTRLQEEVEELKQSEMAALERINQCFRDEERLRSENRRLKEEKEQIRRKEASMLEKISTHYQEKERLRSENRHLEAERDEAVMERNELRSRMGTMTVQVTDEQHKAAEEVPHRMSSFGDMLSKITSTRNLAEVVPTKKLEVTPEDLLWD